MGIGGLANGPGWVTTGSGASGGGTVTPPFAPIIVRTPIFGRRGQLIGHKTVYADPLTGMIMGDVPPDATAPVATEPQRKYFGAAVTDFSTIKRRLDEITGKAFEE